mgnify:FL=1
MLELYTEFELATAQQLAFDRNREKPNQSDLEDAIKLAAKWNAKRIEQGLRPFQ